MATVVGTSGDDVIVVGGGADSTLNGMDGNDYLEGGSGNDIFDVDYGTLTGTSAGIDIMRGRGGNDAYYVNDASDQIIEDSALGGTDSVSSEVSYTLSTNVENLTLLNSAANGTGNTLVNTITGNASDNIIDGGANADTMDGGGGGNDTFYVDNVSDVVMNVSAAPDTDTVAIISRVDYFLDGSGPNAAQLNGDIEVVSLAGTAAVDVIGNGQANTLVGNSATNILDGGFANGILPGDEIDTLNGGAGADTMIGRDGDDLYFVDNAGDTITEGLFEGSDTIKSTITVNLNNLVRYANVENLILTGTANINGTAYTVGFGNAITGNSGRNTLTGGNGNDILSGGQNTGLLVDRMIGGDGDDTFIVYNTGDVIIEAAGEGLDEVIVFTSFSLSAASMIGEEIEILTMIGTAVSGTGNALDNIISGNSLNNTLNGMAGDDTLVGGDGDDLFFVDTADDFVDEILDQGTDTVSSTIDYTLTTFVENLILTGTANIDGTGNDYDNTITGNSGDNSLDGGIGADTMIGGLGDDTYIVDQIDDVVTETSSVTSTDTVRSEVSFTLGDNVEDLVLTGTNAIDGTGNSGGNVITGNDEANTLDGAGGGDTLNGGLGDDYYIIDGGDTVTDTGGTDTVETSASFTLSAGIENLVLTGAANINGTGEAGVNTITGNDGSNTLDGQAGADTMAGGAGNDTYVVDDALDVVTEVPLEGTDTVLSGVTYTLGANLENLTLTGVAAIDGTGNAEDNTITGNAAANILLGGIGNDVYFVDENDSLTENAAEGTDSVFFTTSVAGSTFVLGANVENLTILGANAVNGTGNAEDNIITGNSAVNTLIGNGGADTLDGGAGADTMDGGLGDDSFVVDNVGDVVIDAGGSDTLQTSATFNLLTNGMGIENLTLGGALAINGTGDNSTNVITGNANNNVLTGLGGDDTLSGGGGIDTMLGGLGDDLFIVDSSTDIVTELTGQGTDTVQSSATYTLTSSTAANNFVEILTLTGVANINGTGNTLVNTITGNTGNNTLDGSTGADTLIGGDGDDTYIVDDAGDVVTELAGEGEDTIRSSASYNLGALPEIENLILTGTTNADGVGNIGDNTLVGNAGVNTLIGGAGDDTYIINSNDVVLEGSGQGTDTLIVTITSGSYTVPANFENVIIIGAGNFNLTGDGGSNTLNGNIGNNTLDGGAGADVMAGGRGTDVYIVDDAGDVVTENAGEGTDTVRSSVDFTLTANVENLLLTGTANIDGTGNGGDNIITGNIGNNTLDGGLGTDKLIGGLGDDSYIIDNNRDVIFDTGGNDTVFAPYSYVLAAALEDLVLTGTGNLNGTGSGFANVITGNTGDNVLSGLAGNDALVAGDGDDSLIGGLGRDIMTGGDGDDFYSIDNALDVITELAGEGDDVAIMSASFVFDPTSEIETITMTGTAALLLTATDTDNFITATVGSNRISALDGDDVIFGLGGNDSIDAGLGNDTIIGGTGLDTIRGGGGADTFVIEFASPTVSDTILDFNIATDNDVLDISDLLGSYDPLLDVLTDFVRIRDSGNGLYTIVQVDANGTASPGGFVTVAALMDITGLTGEAALVASGNLIVS